MIVGVITAGHSEYDDAIYSWLNKHYPLFERVRFSSMDSYDFIGAWGLLVLSGCTFRLSKDNVVIEYEGVTKVLLARLNELK